MKNTDGIKINIPKLVIQTPITISITTDSFFWSLLIILAWLPCFAYIFNWPLLVSLGIYGTVGLFTIFFIGQVLRSIINREKSTPFVTVVLFFLAITIIIAYWKRGSFVERELRNYIYLLIIIEGFILCYLSDIKSEYLHILYRLPFLITIVMVLMAFRRESYDLNSYRNALYLGYQNPNILSFVLVMMMVFQGLGYLDEKEQKYVVGLLLDTVLIVLTHARSSLIAALMILIFLFGIKKQIKIYRFAIILITSIPLFVVILLPYLTRVVTISLYGKPIDSGRLLIWNRLFSLYSSNRLLFLFGKGSYVANYVELTNGHNAYVQFISNFGVPSFIIYFLCLIALGFYAIRYNCDQYSTFAIMSLIPIFLNNSFETHLTDAIIGITLLWIAIYWIVISRGRQQERSTNVNNG